MVSEKTF